MITIEELLSKHLTMFLNIRMVKVIDIESGITFKSCGKFYENIKDSQCKYMLECVIKKWSYANNILVVSI